MRLGDFPFLADENVHREVVASLRAEGRDVLDVRESGWSGSSDAELLRRAFASRRVILTHDRDFGALYIARLEPVYGIVYLRPGHIDPRFTLDTLRVLFSRNPELTPPFLLVAKRSGNSVTIRVRSL
ncbi:MAG: DUF5615 family PIN-like protein [Pirellulaceae bacterium]|nr:DUF5615 family PIN-like protein [Pirellulaceae bacterium]